MGTLQNKVATHPLCPSAQCQQGFRPKPVEAPKQV